MRAVMIVLEGTPAELDESALAGTVLDALRGQRFNPDEVPPGSVNPTVTGESLPVAGVPTEGQETVQRLLNRGPAPAHLRTFFEEATSWPDVRLYGKRHRGSRDDTALDYTDYLRLRRIGSPVGGFAYVWPETGVILFRLAVLDDGMRAAAPAAVLTSGGHRAYRVKITVTDGTTLAQALDLAKHAYELTRL